MLTFEEFRNGVMHAMSGKPKDWRDGQFVFNYIDENYGVARTVQFNNRNVDCFYDDSKIDDFIREAYDEYVNVEQSYEEYAFEDLDHLFEEQKNKELEFYRAFMNYLQYECVGHHDTYISAISETYNEFVGYVKGEWIIKNNHPRIKFTVDSVELTANWFPLDCYGVWQQCNGIEGDSYSGYLLFPKSRDEFFVVKFNC